MHIRTPFSNKQLVKNGEKFSKTFSAKAMINVAYLPNLDAEKKKWKQIGYPIFTKKFTLLNLFDTIFFFFSVSKQ